ncbi:MAG TPA: LysM peptidoglycan-binding domain-containing protein, partial [Bacteroidia bacterium]|nr:LysM peptidoglycan-binding domain-containing protein [Bacteroidia bacterium]
LKFLNPWLMNDRLSNSQKLTYFITLPKKDVPFAELGENIIYSDSIPIPVQPAIATSSAKPDSAHPKIIVHVVQPDETMESIAKQYNVTVEQLRTWNSISDTVKVKARDELMIFEKQ